MLKSLHRPIALLALAALAACNSTAGTPNVGSPLPSNGGLKQQNFVGVGDSLTFGEQSEGMLGVLATSPDFRIARRRRPPGSNDGFLGAHVRANERHRARSGTWLLEYRYGFRCSLHLAAAAHERARTRIATRRFRSIAAVCSRRIRAAINSINSGTPRQRGCKRAHMRARPSRT